MSSDNPNPIEATDTTLCVHYDGIVGRSEHKNFRCGEPFVGRYDSAVYLLH